MKLPAGKVISSQSGGIETLLNLLQEFKKEKFMGYVTLSRNRPDGIAIGQVIFKQGLPLLADYTYAGTEIMGTQSIDDLIEDSLQPETKIEVHGKVDTELMILYFQKAKLDPAKGDLETKLRVIVEKLLKEKAERELREQTEQRRSELGAQMKEWADQGYNVSRLEKPLQGDIETMEKAFLDFEGDTAQLQELTERVDSLIADEFTEEVEPIKPLLKDPDQIAQIRKSLEEIDKVIGTKKAEVDKLSSQVSNWKDQGFVVDELKEALLRPLGGIDVASIRKDMDVTQKAIVQLEEHKKRLAQFKMRDLEPSIEDIRAMLNDPSRLDEIASAIDDLKTTVKEIGEKRNQLVNKVNEWKKQGYKVTRLGDISSIPLREAEDTVSVMEIDIQRLTELSAQLDSLDTSDFKKEVSALKTKMKDPDAIAQIEEGINDITSRLQDISQRRTELKERMEEFRGQGYNTSKLEAIMESDLETMEKVFLDFEAAVETLLGFQDELNGLDTTLIPDQVEPIESMLHDPDAIPKIEKALKKLITDLQKAEERKSVLVKKVEAYRGEGFNVAGFESSLSNPLSTIEEAVRKLDADIATLKKLRKKVEALDSPDVSLEVNEILGLLTDPDSIETAGERIKDVEKKLVDIKSRRKDIESQVAAWKKEGYITLSIDAALKRDLSELEGVFADFQVKINELKGLQEQLKGLDTTDFGAEIEAISLRLKNPDAISVIKNILDDMNLKIEENKQLREEMRLKAREWKNMGYSVSTLERSIDQEIGKAKEVYDRYRTSVEKIIDLTTQLDLISNERFIPERDELKKAIKDPLKADEYEKSFTDFRDRIARDTQQRATLQAKIDDWKAQGMEVTQIQKILLDEPLETVMPAFEAFEADIKTLLELQAKLRGGSHPPSGVPATHPSPEKVAPAAPSAPTPPAPTTQTESTPAPADTSLTPDAEKDMVRDLNGDSNLLQEYLFKNFVVGTSNRFTHAAAMAVSESPAEAYNPLFIYGGAGLGKTHLLNAIGNHIKETKPDLKVIFLTSEKFTNDLINAVKNDKLGAFRDKYRKADILLIDDIQFLAGKESTQEEFFHTFNALYNAHKQIVITSDRPPKDITTLEEKLKSRFEGGLITDIQPPSLETKIIILRREAKKHNMQIPDEVLHHIASKIKSNIRELEGALVKVAAYSSLINKEITLELADEALKDMLIQEEDGTPVEVKQEQNFSSIEERLSTLRKKISPMLSKTGATEKKKATY